MMLLKLFFWIAVFCLITGISVVPAILLGFVGLLVAGVTNSLFGHRGGRGPTSGNGLM